MSGGKKRQRDNNLQFGRSNRDILEGASQNDGSSGCRSRSCEVAWSRGPVSKDRSMIE